jgi:hypothetical protein
MDAPSKKLASDTGRPLQSIGKASFQRTQGMKTVVVIIIGKEKGLTMSNRKLMAVCPDCGWRQCEAPMQWHIQFCDGCGKRNAWTLNEPKDWSSSVWLTKPYIKVKKGWFSWTWEPADDQYALTNKLT